MTNRKLKIGLKLLGALLTSAALSACASRQSQPTGTPTTDNIVMHFPENNATEVTTDELIKIYFKEPPVYDRDGYITIHKQDGTVFEKISVSSDRMIDKDDRRILFDPERDFEIGESYYIAFDEKPFGRNASITRPAEWTFTVGSRLIKKNLTYEGTDFRLLIRLPTGYDPQGTQRYPVIYLTDGGFFNSSEYAKIGQAAKEGKIRQVIVVGLAYPENATVNDVRRNRFRDMGQRPKYLFGYLKDRVIPYIEETYKTDQANRTLMGNSAGGYFTMWVLLQYRKGGDFPFHNLIAVAPPPSLLELEKEQAAAISDLPLNVFLAVGMEDRLEGFVAGVQQLVKRLESHAYPSLNLKYRFLKGLPHGEVSSSPAFSEALELFLAKK